MFEKENAPTTQTFAFEFEHLHSFYKILKILQTDKRLRLYITSYLKYLMEKTAELKRKSPPPTLGVEHLHCSVLT